MLFGVVQVGIADAELLKAQFRAPILDLLRQAGEIYFRSGQSRVLSITFYGYHVS